MVTTLPIQPISFEEFLEWYPENGKSDEYDLAMAVIEAIESRNERNGLEVERFLFKNEKKKKVS